MTSEEFNYKNYFRRFIMSDGKEVLLRPIKPEDEPLEAALFETFSDETKRYRFFRVINEIDHDFLVRHTQIDYNKEVAIVAEIEENGERKIAGVVRLIGDEYNEKGEFAIVVGDPWQGKGLGKIMTDYMLNIAKERNLGKVYAVLLNDNFIMKKMLLDRGFKFRAEDQSYYAELNMKAYKRKIRTA